MGEVSLELLQGMMQRVLDGQAVIRDDISDVRREVGVQDQIDALTRRLEPVEGRVN